MSDELKACPFCGKSDIHIEQKGTFFWCECYDCGAISREHRTLPGVHILQSEDFARGYWNDRPIEDELESRIAELKELLDTESQLSNQFYLLLVDNPKSKKLADDLIEALRINGKEVQG